MGFMKKWEALSQKLYDKFGSKLQPMYNRIDDWKLPDYVKKAFDKIWEELSPELKKKLYRFAIEVCKEFNEKYARELIKTLIALVLGKKKKK